MPVTGLRVMFHSLDEPFLKSKLFVFIPLETEYRGMNRVRAALNIRFPRLCTGCLQETASTSSWKEELTWRSTTLTASVETLTMTHTFKIPMCSRCVEADLLWLTAIKSKTYGADIWGVTFRFANVAYLEPFASANGHALKDRIASPPSSLMAKGLDEVKRRPEDIALYEEQVGYFRWVEERFGFHRYLAARRDLRKLERKTSRRDRKKDPAEVRGAIERTLAVHGLTLADAADLDVPWAKPLKIFEVLRKQA